MFTLVRYNELESYYDDAEYVQTGDYVLWDTRLAHSTGERNTFSASEDLRQAFYCSFVLQSQDESGLHKRMIQSCRHMSTAPEWAPSSSSSPFLAGFEAEKLRSSVGKALCVVFERTFREQYFTDTHSNTGTVTGVNQEESEALVMMRRRKRGGTK